MPKAGLTYIAIVDDDESIRRSYGRWLRAAGFTPVEYPSAEAFLADQRQPDFECLILDVRLPRMSGLELGRRLAAVNVLTPTVYLTAHDEPAVRAEALALGCAGFFRKTDAGSEVLAVISRAIGFEPGPPHAPPDAGYRP